MQNKINKLNDIYKDKISSILNEICPENNLSTETSLDFGSLLSDIFNISDTREYDEYIDIITKIEVYDPRLALKLERYLAKEINLTSLLAFHVAYSVKGKSLLGLGESF